MTTAQKLKTIAEVLEEMEGHKDFYKTESEDCQNSDTLREYYAYRCEIYKAITESLLSKVTKL